MKSAENEYTCKGSVWKSEGPGGWHFITLYSHLSQIIRKNHSESEENFGRLKCRVQCEHCLLKASWSSALWYDLKHDAYLLPIKAKFREKLGIAAGSEIKVQIIVDR